MRIQKTDRTNFGAQYINNPCVKRLVNGVSSIERVSFLRFDAKNPDDLKALEELLGKWDGAQYVKSVHATASAIVEKEISEHSDNIYILTSQSDNFEKLNSDKILGLTDVRTVASKAGHISHIEVNPKYLSGDFPEYKKCGKAMLDSLKELYNMLEAIVHDHPKVKKFYEDNDFYEIAPGTNAYRWCKDIFSILWNDMNKYFNI